MVIAVGKVSACPFLIAGSWLSEWRPNREEFAISIALEEFQGIGDPPHRLYIGCILAYSHFDSRK